jgi:hypothetical protein
VVSYKQQSSDLIPASATTDQLTALLQAVPGINTIVVELEDNSQPNSLCTPSGFVAFSSIFKSYVLIRLYSKPNAVLLLFYICLRINFS